jgi:hypothetical protein
MKYDNAAGGAGGKALQVYDGGAWQNVVGELSLAPSLDFNGDGLLDTDIEPNDIRNVYRLRVKGRNFGTAGAEYDVAVLAEDGSVLGQALKQTIWRADATANQAVALEFNTNGAAPFWVDDVSYTLEDVSEPTDYDDWAAGFGLAGADAAPGADPDADGVSNEDEYAFGLDPTDGASVSPVSVPLDAAGGSFRYTRRKPALSGLSYAYQWSATLAGDWAAFTPDAEVSDDGDPVESVEVTVPAALLANGKLFVRVSAE